MPQDKIYLQAFTKPCRTFKLVSCELIAKIENKFCFIVSLEWVCVWKLALLPDNYKSKTMVRSLCIIRYSFFKERFYWDRNEKVDITKF
jgi:hypothetical protein